MIRHADQELDRRLGTGVLLTASIAEFSMINVCVGHAVPVIDRLVSEERGQ